MRRSENQDRVSRTVTPFGDLYVVADGVGGQDGGGEAAQAVASGFGEYLNAHPDRPLAEALQSAAQGISVSLRGRGGSRQMSSTVVLAVVRGNLVTIAHAGDSRAYLARDNRLQLLTRDDSLTERFVSQGILTPAQAREHPDSSVLTQAIGQRAEVRLTIADFALHPGDGLLLCSDGLWAYAEHPEIEAIAVAQNLSVAGIADALLNLAIQGGGGDNISLQFLRFSQPLMAARARRNWLGLDPGVALLLGLAILSMLAAGAGLTFWNLRHPLTIGQPGMQLDPISAPGPTPAVRLSRTVRVIVISASDAPPPDWSGKLDRTKLDDGAALEVQHDRGKPACLALRQVKPVLFYTPSAADRGSELAAKLGVERAAVIPLPPARLAPCGDADLYLLPATPIAAGR